MKHAEGRFRAPKEELKANKGVIAAIKPLSGEEVESDEEDMGPPQACRLGGGGEGFYEEGKALTRYAAVRIADEKVFKEQCVAHSAQAAEIVVVALENMPADETVAIFTDSEWVLRAIVTWMPQWQKRGMKSADGKYIAHAEKLIYLWDLSQQRTQPLFMGKVKAHEKNVEEAQWNKKADEQAKEGAKQGIVWQPQSQ
ncbi:uncharacterized protein LOC115271348 [Terrapene carolina triunguis]|uniref:uncharacterized protein LOC115271348 n=1 Tax=Terrapene triunguis TaxID=2587831 RepID=UPI00115634E8|nr:uncharacterized protein LOC115271348 [Terrapene carolina triunguis]